MPHRTFPVYSSSACVTVFPCVVAVASLGGAAVPADCQPPDTALRSAQDSVSKALWKMGISHKTQHLTADGLFCVDIALDDEQVGGTRCSPVCMQDRAVAA